MLLIILGQFHQDGLLQTDKDQHQSLQLQAVLVPEVYLLWPATLVVIPQRKRLVFFLVNATNNSGYTTSSTKTSNGIQCNNSFGERRGFIKFPLTAIPTGATIVSSSLSLVNNSSTTTSTANNDVKPLGNTYLYLAMHQHYLMRLVLEIAERFTVEPNGVIQEL